jgi:hypothetical protein
MRMVPVVSSLASHIGYDGETRTLGVQHHDGSVFHYSDVHPLTHQALMSSPSKGTFMHTHIRGKKPHKQIK